MGRPLLGVIGIVVVSGIGAIAQERASLPAFEVASVKPNKSADSGGGITRRPGGRFSVINQTLVRLISFAYQIESFQIEGPGWIRSDRFDIVAKAEGDPPVGPLFGPPDQATLMLRTLLADRFKLAMHKEIREMPIYGLVLARGDGKLGPQLRRSTTECVDAPAAAADTRPRCRNGGGPGLLPRTASLCLTSRLS